MVQRLPPRPFPRASRETIRSRTRGVLEIPTKPRGFDGSEPEWLVFQVLIRLGKKPNLDFTHQSGFFGGRLVLGGAIVDFLFTNPEGLAINVNGVFYHYQRGTHIYTRDSLNRQLLARRNITLIFIDEDDLYRDPFYYVQQALLFRDHSRLS